MIYKNQLERVGSTPIIEITAYKGVRLFIKLEGENPSGSLKDRSAKAILESAIQEGKLKNKTILDASSGSFGCAIALFGKCLGVPVEVVSSSKLTQENEDFLKSLGVTVTKIGNTTSEGNTHISEVLLKDNPGKYFFCDQLNNWRSPEAHENGTGPEILADVPDVNAIVMSKGSGATICGVGTYLQKQKKRSGIKIISAVAQDDVSIAGTFKKGDRITPFIKRIQDQNLIDHEYAVTYEEALGATRQLASQGIPVGLQTGGVFASAIHAIDAGWISGKVLLVSGDSVWKNLKTVR